ncbi:hypothetical protein DFH06DRAFT_1306902 [Mycena polygramma]|nr:hypothetical protein DFH06DRAFT_1306902 [Mycena polygramma]
MTPKAAVRALSEWTVYCSLRENLSQGRMNQVKVQVPFGELAADVSSAIHEAYHSALAMRQLNPSEREWMTGEIARSMKLAPNERSVLAGKLNSGADTELVELDDRQTWTRRTRDKSATELSCAWEEEPCFPWIANVPRHDQQLFKRPVEEMDHRTAGGKQPNMGSRGALAVLELVQCKSGEGVSLYSWDGQRACKVVMVGANSLGSGWEDWVKTPSQD